MCGCELRDRSGVCRQRYAGREILSTAFSPPLKIAQPFMAGMVGPLFSQVPVGTKGPCGRPPHFSAVPCGTFHLLVVCPSHKWLGYCHRFAFAQRPTCAPASGSAAALRRFSPVAAGTEPVALVRPVRAGTNARCTPPVNRRSAPILEWAITSFKCVPFRRLGAWRVH